MPTTSSASERLADVGTEVAHAGIVPQLGWPRVVIRTISGCDVPGVVTQCMRKSRSLKSGSSDWPEQRA